jgi:predicted N-formylglutamate amidohydrolase
MLRELLTHADPPAFRVERPAGTATCFFTCDHAGRVFPCKLGHLGVAQEELTRHIAWDIGIAEVAQRVSQKLDAFLIMQTYSRLVIDANRPPGSPQSIVTLSERTPIPGNEHLPEAEAARREREIFRPYHDRIRDELDARAAGGRPTVLVSLHSFTPSFMERSRPWHAGVLYQRDARIGHALLELLRADPELMVGDNEPYAVNDETDYTVVTHGEKRGIPHVEIEIRQDLISTSEGQEAWAIRLAQLLPQTHSGMFPT